jgi:hypothetical protein
MCAMNKAGVYSKWLVCRHLPVVFCYDSCEKLCLVQACSLHTLLQTWAIWLWFNKCVMRPSRSSFIVLGFLGPPRPGVVLTVHQWNRTPRGAPTAAFC